MDLGRLNSATKYPPIFTYHGLGERGVLTDEVTEFHGDVVLTEKVDGTNGRIVTVGDDWFIGSRDQLLTARGDRVANPGLGIVDALRVLAGKLPSPGSQIVTYYLEVYGGKIGASAKQYSTDGTVGYRLFDISVVETSALNWQREKIARWRDDEDGQSWFNEDQLNGFVDSHDVPMVPRLATLSASGLPRGIEETQMFLAKHLPKTNVSLAGSGQGKAEGIVIRNSDRSTIAKARFEDYARTMKKRK